MKNIIYCAMLSLALTFAITAYSDAVASDLENGLIRLHVIANSNSDTDQLIKLAVRDRILSDLHLTTPDATAMQAQEIANDVLRENGFSYTAHALFTTAHFPKKEYAEFTLPQGNYRAVRVILGDGKGENWWCVLYPPVCMADARNDGNSAREELSENLSPETYDIITRDIEIRFRLLDWLGSI